MREVYCSDCGGNGYWFTTSGFMSTTTGDPKKIICKRCQGTGKVWMHWCFDEPVKKPPAIEIKL